MSAADNSDQNQYRAVFTNTAGSVPTTAAILSVYEWPIIDINPQDKVVTAGQTASFSVHAIGRPTPTAQWQVSTDGGNNFTDISGATSTTLSFTTTAAMTGNIYHAVLTNPGGTATSWPAALTVDTVPVVTLNPAGGNVLYNMAFTLSAAASGNPAPTVQWQSSVIDDGSGMKLRLAAPQRLN